MASLVFDVITFNEMERGNFWLEVICVCARARKYNDILISKFNKDISSICSKNKKRIKRIRS